MGPHLAKTYKYVGLVRGINVGGNNLVKMDELRQCLTSMGLEQVETLLQSGNFVFAAAQTSARNLEKDLREMAKTQLKLEVEFFVRSPSDLRKVIEGNPFKEIADSDPSRLLVYFLPVGTITSDFHECGGPERIAFGPDVIYVHFPEGVGKSKLLQSSQWKKLAARATARNWNTVRKIAQKAESTP